MSVGNDPFDNETELKEAFDKVKSGEFASGSSAQQLDDVYETLKDFESAVGTIGAANGVTTWAPTSNTPAHTIGALGGDAIADSDTIRPFQTPSINSSRLCMR